MLVTAAPVRVTKSKKTVKKLPSRIRGERQPLPYPRLVDPKQERQLRQIFEPYRQLFFAAPSFNGYIAMMTSAFFNSKVISNYGQTGAVSNLVNKPSKVFSDKAVNLADISVSKGALFPRVKVSKDSVVLYTNPIEHEFILDVPGPGNIDGAKEFQDYIKKLIPTFNIPRNFIFNSRETPPVELEFKTPATTGWKPTIDFQKFPYDQSMGYTPENVDFLEQDPTLTKETLTCLYSRITINKISSHNVIALGVQGTEPQTGTVKSDQTFMATVSVETEIRLPMEVALWMMNQSDPKEFIPKAFFDFCCEHVHFLMGKTNNEPPLRNMLISDIYKINMDNKAKYNIDDSPRTNKEGFVIDRNGEVLHIPSENNIDTYINGLKSSYNPDTGDLVPTSKQKDLHNLPIYADWVNGYFTYTTGEGSVYTTNLNGSIPLDDVTIGKHLSRLPVDLWGVTDPDQTLYEKNAEATGANIMSMIDTMIQAGIRFGFKIFVQPNIGNQQTWQSVVQYWNVIQNISEPIGDVLTLKNADDYSETQIEIINSFVHTMRNLNANFDKIQHYGVSTNNALHYWVTLFAQYGAKEGAKYQAIYRDSVNRNTVTPVTQLPDSINLPNVGEGKFVLPQQLDVVSQMSKAPNLAVFDISPGGGKTSCTIFDVLQLLQQKKIKRPLVIAPPRIVSEWCTEINRVSHGKINAIPLTRQVIRRMVKVMGVDRQGFVEYCKNAPPNTIFIATMNLFSLKRDLFQMRVDRNVVRYGNQRIFNYPQIWLAQEIGFDYICVDEAQAIKSTKSQVTKAIQQIMSRVPFKRLSSGTLVKNRGDDLVGEFSSLNPAIYGSISKFYDKYASTEGKKFKAFKPGAELAIRKEGQAYTSWITKRRQDWSYLLPTIHTDFFRCDLTESQQLFYVQLITEAEEDIKKDKKLMKLLAEGDPDKEDEIARKMKPYLAKIEIFVNCPDTDRVPFKELSTTEQDDLVSPKVKLVEEILQHHFTGGSFEGISFIKQNAKVIILVYNPEIVHHFERNLQTKYKGVFYTAGADDVLVQFKEDPSINFMVAAEDSIKEGLNLQVASRIIRTQTLWSPGSQEQALSRVMRPDVMNKHNRQEINYNWVLCVDGNSWIPTEKGLVKLKTISENKYEDIKLKVSSNSGFSKAVAFINKGRKETLTLKTWLGNEICGTSDHKVRIFDENNYSFKWKKLKNVSTSDMLCLPTYKTTRKDPYKLDNDIQRSVTHPNRINFPEFVTPELAWLTGFWVAEGCVNGFQKDGIPNEIRVINKDTKLIETFCDYFEKTFSVRPKIFYERDKWGCHWASMCSCEVVRFLIKNGMDLAKKWNYKYNKRPAHYKEIPKFIMESNEDCQLAYLAGYIEGDGGITRHNIKVTSASKELINQTFYLALSHGYIGQLKGEKNIETSWGTTKPYSIDWGGYMATELGKKLNTYFVSKHYEIPNTFKTGGHAESISLEPLKNHLRKRFSRKIGGNNNTEDKRKYLYLNDEGKEVSIPRELAIFKMGNSISWYHPKVDKIKALGDLGFKMATKLWDALQNNYAYSHVKSLRNSGIKDVFDLSMAPGKSPSFVANGVLVHNCSKTMEVAKTARLISKIVSNMMLSEGENPAFQSLLQGKQLDQLPLVSMSLDAIKEYQQADVDRERGILQEDPLEEYYQMYGVIIDYEKAEFESRKERLRRMVGKKLGIDPDKVTRDQLISGSFTPIKSNNVLPGSKSIWVPVQNGAMPHDPYGLHLVALAGIHKEVDEEESEGEEENEIETGDEDDDNSEDQVTYGIGDLVQTEYGFGHIVGFTKRQVKVDVPGVPFSLITLPKTVVFKPTDEDAAARVAKILRAQKHRGLHFLNGMDNLPTKSTMKVVQKPSMPTIVQPAKKPKTIDQEGEEIQEDEDKVVKPKKRNADKLPPNKAPIEINAGVFDGKPCLFMFTAETNAKKVMEETSANWRTYAPFVYRHVRTFQGLKNLMVALEDHFEISDTYLDRLENAGKRLYRRGKPHLIQREPMEWNFKTFLNITTHKTVKNPKELRLYPMLVDGLYYVVGNINTQRRNIQKFKTMNIPGVAKGDVHEAVHIISFNNIPAAIRFLENLRTKFKIKDFNNSVEVLNESYNMLKL